jgi:hypothetical protein
MRLIRTRFRRARTQEGLQDEITPSWRDRIASMRPSTKGGLAAVASFTVVIGAMALAQPVLDDNAFADNTVYEDEEVEDRHDGYDAWGCGQIPKDVWCKKTNSKDFYRLLATQDSDNVCAKTWKSAYGNRSAGCAFGWVYVDDNYAEQAFGLVKWYSAYGGGPATRRVRGEGWW